MKLDYVPLLPIQRDLYRIPRDVKTSDGKPYRFLKYIQTFSNRDGTLIHYPPLVGINPMAKDNVAVLVDAYLTLDADGIAARATTEASARHADLPGEFKATLVVMDDWMGWSHRANYEYGLRFGSGPPPERLPRWTKHFWVTGFLWSSEPANERAPREAMLTMIHRLAHMQRHGPARTLRDKLAQEGHAMALAGCAGPTLDPEDIAYTREVIAPFLDAEDHQTAMECLFGDPASRALGFTPRGLSPWAGLALALHDATVHPAAAR